MASASAWSGPRTPKLLAAAVVRADACPGVADADCMGPVARALADKSDCTFSTHDLALGEVLAAVSGASELDTLACAIKLFDRSTLEELLRSPSAGREHVPAAP